MMAYNILPPSFDPEEHTTKRERTNAIIYRKLEEMQYKKEKEGGKEDKEGWQKKGYLYTSLAHRKRQYSQWVGQYKCSAPINYKSPPRVALDAASACCWEQPVGRCIILILHTYIYKYKQENPRALRWHGQGYLYIIYIYISYRNG
jgi:hypothetical protein